MLLTYSYRSLVSRRMSNLGAMLGIALVVFVLAAALMLVAGLERAVGKAGSADTVVVVARGSESELESIVPLSSVPLVLGHPAIKAEGAQPAATAEQLTALQLDKVGTKDGQSNVLFRGVTESSVRFRPNLRVVAGREPRIGTDEAMLGSLLRGRFTGTDLGQTIELSKNRHIEVVGIFTDGGSAYESEVWMDRDLLQQVAGYGPNLSSVRARLTSDGAFEGYRTALRADKRLAVEVFREDAYLRAQSSSMATMLTVLGLSLASLMGLSAMLGAAITMYSSVANRRREIGTLRALGFPRQRILSTIVTESVILSGLGGLLGAAASLLLGFVKISMINTATWSELVFSFEPNAQTIGVALAAAVAMGTLGGFSPALRAASLSPINALRK